MTTDQEMRQLAENATDGPWDSAGSRGIYVSMPPDGSYQRFAGFDEHDDAAFAAACREWVPEAIKRLEAVRELQNKIARHAQQDREEGRPAAALLAQIADDLDRAIEEI